MSSDFHRVPMIRLLGAAFDEFSEQLTRRVLAAGYTDIRPGHGCDVANNAPDGSRLTDLPDRAGKPKQSVGEATSDLAHHGHHDRRPDPDDGRRKVTGPPYPER